MKYRMIDVQNVVVSEEHYQSIVQALNAEGWGAAPAHTKYGKVSLYLSPMEARENIQALKDIAPWVAKEDVEAKIVLEQETCPVTWLHLVYDGQGGMRDVVSPAHQWEIEE